MKINIKDSALDFINSKIASKSDFLFLSLDDGSSKFSKLGGSCAIGNKFKIVDSTVPDADYNIPIENEAGLKLFTSEPELTFIGNGLSLEYKNASMMMKDDSGILDGAVTIDKAEIVEHSAEEMAGARIC